MVYNERPLLRKDMKMYAIPILPETLDLITILNMGVRPQIEDVPTLYIWDGDDHEAVIVGQDRFMAKLFGPAPRKITILHFED
jgi:hypothetical protein